MSKIAAIIALVLLYAYGAGISIEAMELLPQGKETHPGGHAYPAWTAIHFSSALLFAVLAMSQLVSVVRRRHPVFHRYAGKIAVAFGLIAAASGAIIPFAVVPPHPLLERLYLVIYFSGTALCLLMGFRAAKRANFAHHRIWMIRAIATVGAVMTQRIVFPILIVSFGIHNYAEFCMEFVGAFALGWAFNLALAEGWLRWRFVASPGFGSRLRLDPGPYRPTLGTARFA